MKAAAGAFRQGVFESYRAPLSKMFIPVNRQATASRRRSARNRSELAGLIPNHADLGFEVINAGAASDSLIQKSK